MLLLASTRYWLFLRVETAGCSKAVNSSRGLVYWFVHCWTRGFGCMIHVYWLYQTCPLWVDRWFRCLIEQALTGPSPTLSDMEYLSALYVAIKRTGLTGFSRKCIFWFRKDACICYKTLFFVSGIRALWANAFEDWSTSTILLRRVETTETQTTFILFSDIENAWSGNPMQRNPSDLDFRAGRSATSRSRLKRISIGCI